MDGLRNRPNFFIVGAHKAGTTSLYAYLKQHPQIFMPDRIKEPCYFRGDPRFFELGPPLPERKVEYAALFRGSDAFKAVGEASTDYLYYSSKASFNIKQHNPEAKIIIILRNPIERAYSNFIWALKEGIESERNFRQALNLEQARRDEGMGSVWHYKAKGLYASQVRDFVDAFGAQQVKIFLFEDLKEDAARVCRVLFSFLRVEPFAPDTSARHNVSGVARLPALQRMLNQPSGLVKLGYLLPQRFRKAARVALRRMNTNADRKRWPRLEKDDAVYLSELYRADILQLEEIVGRNLAAWLKGQVPGTAVG